MPEPKIYDEIQITSEEWSTVNRYLLEIGRDRKTPFIVEMGDLSTNHSFIVIKKKDQLVPFAIPNTQVYVHSLTQEQVSESALGSGSFGTVFKVVNEKGKALALKIESEQVSADLLKKRLTPEELGLFEDFLEASKERDRDRKMKMIGEHETKIMKKVGTLFGQFFNNEESGDKFTRQKYTLQAFYPDGTLENKLKDVDHMLASDKYYLMLKTISAVQGLHERRILHRDIKPDNIMLFGENTVAIDFNISVHIPRGKLEVKAGPIGVDEYIAPEISKAKKGHTQCTYSTSTEVFSMGKMFERDFKINDPFIQRMTAENPQERPSLKEVFEHFKAQYTVSLGASSFNYFTSYASSKMRQSPASSVLSAEKSINQSLTIQKLITDFNAMPDGAKVDQIGQFSEKILKILVDNQKVHNKATFSTASHFNPETIARLPKELKSEVCKRLDLQEAWVDKNFGEGKPNSWKARKEVSDKINVYIEATAARKKQDRQKPR
ncbi:MAG: protein kinase family protein [Gammaproteobacteria bacterium]